MLLDHKDITVVVTSCGRHDLLIKTLASFLRFYDGRDFCEFIIVEDGQDSPPIPDGLGKSQIIISGDRIGQIRAIDLAYSKVRTPYIFHLEDDWEFYSGCFIEDSKQILKIDLSTICVWLRAWTDTNGHPLSFKSDCGKFGVLAPGFQNGLFNGFTWNPGLRRLSDYNKIGPFSDHTTFKPWRSEAEIGNIYYNMGYRAVILREEGYVRHIGGGRHIDWDNRP